MRRVAHILLVLAATVLLATGNGGLRALHLVSEGGHAERHEGCGHDHDHHHGHGHDADHHEEVADGRADGARDHDHGGHDELACSTCELLLAMGSLLPTEVPAPTFHALVAVTDDGEPAACAAPAPMRAISARPPPAC